MDLSRWLRTSVATSLLLLISPGLTQAQARTQTRPYAGFSDLPITNCNPYSIQESVEYAVAHDEWRFPGSGLTCFSIGAGETTVDVDITDAAALPVLARYAVGSSSGYFCGSVTGIPIPAGATSMGVTIASPLHLLNRSEPLAYYFEDPARLSQAVAPPPCLGAFGTTGHVTATFKP